MTRICRQDALRYLKISSNLLRAWEQKKLIPALDSYTLAEYGQLRTLRDLSSTFTSSTISASLGAMKSVSGVENPLLETRPVVNGSRMLFRHGGVITEPLARQFVFDFEPQKIASGLSPGTLELHSRANRTTEMFLEAVRQEDASETEHACQTYEAILVRNPDHAPTCINLGTICYNRRQFLRAEELYRHATRADPQYALAFFDLGNVLDELKRLAEAIDSYRTAVRLVPTYADAHYNLALAYERTGERRMALRHWTAYLKLENNSRWATHARKQVRKILDREGLAIVHRSQRASQSRSLRRTGRFSAPAIPTAG